MATTSLQGTTCNTNKDLPTTGSTAPAFCALNGKLEEVCLDQFKGKNKLIYAVPSLDTMVCANTTKQLDEIATGLENTQCIVISADLPFAQQRFCEENKLQNVATLSLMRSNQFAEDYGVLLVDGPLASLTARAVFVLDTDNQIIHQELTRDIADAPDFNAATAALKK